jgi:hypothetical protein
MVNGNYGHGRVRVQVYPGGPALPLVPNPDAAALEVGNEVVPNFEDPRARARHVPGVILRLVGGEAFVRWAPGDRQQWLPVQGLVKR